MSPPPNGRRARILIVDDEPMLLRAYQRVVGRVHEVVAAGGVAEALAILERDAAFDAVVCDFLMPPATGLDLFREVERRFPELARRFLFATGKSAQEMGVLPPHLRCVEKPVDFQRLIGLIAEVAGLG